MTGIDTSKLSVSDVRVALVSLVRRARAAFAPTDDDGPSIDELARRMGHDGTTAADHLAHAAGTIGLVESALDAAHVGSVEPLHPAIGDRSRRTFVDDEAPVSVVLDRIDTTVSALLARIDDMQPDEWTDRRPVVGRDADVSLLWLVQEAVAVLSDELSAATKALQSAAG